MCDEPPAQKPFDLHDLLGGYSYCLINPLLHGMQYIVNLVI